MISEEELEEALDNSPAPRVTKEYIMSRVVSTEYIRASGTITICIHTLDNGFKVTGESACVSPDNYNRIIGESIAYDNAFNKLWPLFGFLLAEKLRGKIQ